MAIDVGLLERKIAELLDIFYEKRTTALNELQLIDTLKRKNPYLFRAMGVAAADDIVEEVLRAHVSSSDETKFGNDFFEPLVRWAAEQANPGASVVVSDGEGVDITIYDDRSITPIAVKSGVNVFNSSSKKKQGENFESLRKRLNKMKLHFDPVVGYCYGKKKQSAKSTVNFKELAGQDFWAFLTNDHDFYLKVVRLMRDKPLQHRVDFMNAFDKAKNRLSKEFLNSFSDDSGAIDWDKLLMFNSGQQQKDKK